MKLQPDQFDVQSITAYGEGWVAINGEKHAGSLIISSQGLRLSWPVNRFEDLTEAHFEQLADIDCELIVFGSGRRNRFPPAAWLKALMARRIGLETMDTQAACRTYNILAQEGRKVAAALLIEGGEPAQP